MDEPVNYRMAERSWDMMRKLEAWDVCFPVDDKGRYDVLQVHPKGKFCVTMKEPELKTILARKGEPVTAHQREQRRLPPTDPVGNAAPDQQADRARPGEDNQ